LDSLVRAPAINKPSSASQSEKRDTPRAQQLDDGFERQRHPIALTQLNPLRQSMVREISDIIKKMVYL
jgi:hypothetical protein